MDKLRLKRRLETAVRNTHQRFRDFQGVIPFGSFANPRIQNPRDIDLIPVLETYNGCWSFSTNDEGEYDDAYYEYEEMEKLFGTHFREFKRGYTVLFKTSRKKNGLFHIESLVALDNLPQLRANLEHYSAKPENFIGTERARQIILESYRDK